MLVSHALVQVPMSLYAPASIIPIPQVPYKAPDPYEPSLLLPPTLAEEAVSMRC